MKKTKLKAKVKAKAKSKLKSKSVTKSKGKLKSKAKLKTKVVAKKKIKAKKKAVKKPAKKKIAKSSKARKSPAKSKPKAKKSGPKEKLKSRLSGKQKEELLVTIAKIINLHKSDRDGLKSLTAIETILDKFNQKFKEADEKFDAIVKYGVAEDPSSVGENVFVPTQGKDRETLDLYKLLVDIAKGKIKFADIKRRMEDLYADAQESRQ